MDDEFGPPMFGYLDPILPVRADNRVQIFPNASITTTNINKLLPSSGGIFVWLIGTFAILVDVRKPAS